ncbi:hypothetical protein [Chryseobacterium carnipullorum]|uniref:hypothetical protein n=1 Tax=Chryseobacterium carnipullorum TaxID=1124835 RepID=UPI000E9B8A2E|nr:hypothetical protein [Chryseobacterium carnipullorum]HBV14176.1 hypothetical protein [Chryseobacterium carnipullorum]
MKKFLLTATMLVGLSAVSKAQQGRVGINTTTPSATLDVVANTTDNTRPDALLVPRMTAAELSAKDNTSGTYGAPQNGAMVYITSGTGTGPRKAKITGAGFYYFDNVVPEWKPFGGGAAPVGMTVRAQTAGTISDADLGNAILVTSNTTFDLSILTKTNGKTISFIDTTPNGTGFSVTGAHSSATVSPIQAGGTLTYICDGTNWYTFNGF